MTMNPVVHFEMPGEDMQRMADFYSKTFGWQMNMMGPDMGNYIVTRTGEVDEKNMLKKPGMINGGFFPKTADSGGAPLVVIAVGDVKEHMEKVKAAGGSILKEPVEIPGIGWYVSFIDTEGNRVAMLQPNQRM